MSITENINKIRTAVLGKEVRSAIADSIEECYKDATTKDNANMEVSKARGNYNTLDDRLNTQDLKLSDKATVKALAVERARINSLASLKEGSTTGDAELADIRIKADGTSADSAGSAVREQVVAVDNKISEVRELTESKNIFNVVFEDGNINPSSGELIANATTKYARTKEFIEIDYVGDLAFQYNKDSDHPVSAVYIFAYRADKTFVERLTNKNIFANDNKLYANVTLSSDVKYLKILFEIATDKASTDYVSYINSMKFQLEYGLTATEYKPYMLELKQKKKIDILEHKIAKLETLTEASRNIYNTQFETGAIQINTGTKIVLDDYIRTDLISVDSDKDMIFSVNYDISGNFPSKTTYIYIASYDENKNFIEMLDKTTNVITEDTSKKATIAFKTSKTAKYILFTMKMNESITAAEGIDFFNNNQVQLEYGTVSTNYVPCGAKIPKENIKDIEIIEDKIKLIANETTDVTNPLKVLKETAGLTRIFNTIACIGDSVTKGYSDNSISELNGDYVEYSYPTQLAKITNCNVINWGVSGATTGTWLEGYKGSTAHNECFDGEHKCDAYIIGLGGNDYIREKPIGTIDDIKEDYNDNADSFYGNMDKIIRKIKEVQPKARIFICTYVVRRNDFTDINNRIRELVDSNRYTNTYLIDLDKYARNIIDTSENSCDFTGKVHQSAIGYLKKAYAINTYIDWIIRNNLTEFKDIQFMNV